MTFVNNKKSNILLKAVSLVVVCTFFIDTIAYAAPSPRIATNLAVESRIKPFFEEHGLGFMNLYGVAAAAAQLRELNNTTGIRKSHIMRLNRLFSAEEVSIDPEIGEREFSYTQRSYRYATFYFGKDKKPIEVRFVREYENLTEDELLELGVRTEEDREYFSSPALIDTLPKLEGVWFVDPERTERKALSIGSPEMPLKEFILEGDVQREKYSVIQAEKYIKIFDATLAGVGISLVDGYSPSQEYDGQDPLLSGEDRSTRRYLLPSKRIDPASAHLYSTPAASVVYFKDKDVPERAYLMILKPGGMMVGYGVSELGGDEARFRYQIFHHFRNRGFGNEALKIITHMLYRQNLGEQIKRFNFFSYDLWTEDLERPASPLSRLILKNGFVAENIDVDKGLCDYVFYMDEEEKPGSETGSFESEAKDEGQGVQNKEERSASKEGAQDVPGVGKRMSEEIKDEKSSVSPDLAEAPLEIPKTYFGRNGYNLIAIVRQAMAKMDRGETFNVLTLGSSSGQEGYDVAMSIAEYIDQTGRRFKTDLVITDVDPRLVAIAEKGIYPTEQALHPLRERNTKDLTKEDSESRYRKFFSPIDSNYSRILSPEEFRDRWGIHISFDTVDITDQGQMVEKAENEKFNLIIARNVHYYSYEAVDPRHSMVLDNIDLILKENGLVNEGYGTFEWDLSDRLAEAGALALTRSDIEIYREKRRRVFKDCFYKDSMSAIGMKIYFELMRDVEESSKKMERPYISMKAAEVIESIVSKVKFFETHSYILPFMFMLFSDEDIPDSMRESVIDWMRLWSDREGYLFALDRLMKYAPEVLEKGAAKRVLERVHEEFRSIQGPGKDDNFGSTRYTSSPAFLMAGAVAGSALAGNIFMTVFTYLYLSSQKKAIVEFLQAKSSLGAWYSPIALHLATFTRYTLINMELFAITRYFARSFTAVGLTVKEKDGSEEEEWEGKTGTDTILSEGQGSVKPGLSLDLSVATPPQDDIQDRAEELSEYKKLVSKVKYVDPDRMSYGDLIVSLTDHCPNKCDHCMFFSGYARRTESSVMTWEGVNKVSDIIKEGDFEDLTITGGGEPWLEKEKVLHLIKTAPVRSIHLITSAYWADTPENTDSVIKEILENMKENPSLRDFTLEVSVDIFHQEYVPLENIVNVISVLSERKVHGRIGLVVKGLRARHTGKKDMIKQLISRLEVEDQNAGTVGGIPIVPSKGVPYQIRNVRLKNGFGFKIDNNVLDPPRGFDDTGIEYEKHDIREFLARKTHYLGRTGSRKDVFIDPAGNLNLHCFEGNLFRGLAAGNIYRMTDREVLDAEASNPIYRALRKKGAGYVMDIAMEAAPDISEKLKNHNNPDGILSEIFKSPALLVYVTKRIIRIDVKAGLIDPEGLEDILDMSQSELLDEYVLLSGSLPVEHEESSRADNKTVVLSILDDDVLSQAIEMATEVLPEDEFYVKSHYNVPGGEACGIVLELKPDVLIVPEGSRFFDVERVIQTACSLNPEVRIIIDGKEPAEKDNPAKRFEQVEYDDISFRLLMGNLSEFDNWFARKIKRLREEIKFGRMVPPGSSEENERADSFGDTIHNSASVGFMPHALPLDASISRNYAEEGDSNSVILQGKEWRFDERDYVLIELGAKPIYIALNHQAAYLFMVEMAMADPGVATRKLVHIDQAGHDDAGHISDGLVHYSPPSLKEDISVHKKWADGSMCLLNCGNYITALRSLFPEMPMHFVYDGGVPGRGGKPFYIATDISDFYPEQAEGAIVSIDLDIAWEHEQLKPLEKVELIRDKIVRIAEKAKTVMFFTSPGYTDKDQVKILLENILANLLDVEGPSLEEMYSTFPEKLDSALEGDDPGEAKHSFQSAFFMAGGAAGTTLAGYAFISVFTYLYLSSQKKAIVEFLQAKSGLGKWYSPIARHLATFASYFLLNMELFAITRAIARSLAAPGLTIEEKDGSGKEEEGEVPVEVEPEDSGWFDIKTRLEEMFGFGNYNALRSSVILNIEDGLELANSSSAILEAIEQLVARIDGELDRSMGEFRTEVPIEIEAFRGGSHVCIRVKDKSDWIRSPETAVKVFDPSGNETPGEKEIESSLVPIAATVDALGGIIDVRVSQALFGKDPDTVFTIWIPASGQQRYGKEFRSISREGRKRPGDLIYREGIFSHSAYYLGDPVREHEGSIGRLLRAIDHFYGDNPQRDFMSATSTGMRMLEEDENLSEEEKERISKDFENLFLGLYEQIYRENFIEDIDHLYSSENEVIAREAIAKQIDLRDKQLALIVRFGRESRGILPDKPEYELVFDYIAHTHNRMVEYYYDLEVRADKLGIGYSLDRSSESSIFPGDDLALTTQRRAYMSWQYLKGHGVVKGLYFASAIMQIMLRVSTEVSRHPGDKELLNLEQELHLLEARRLAILEKLNVENDFASKAFDECEPDALYEVAEWISDMALFFNSHETALKSLKDDEIFSKRVDLLCGLSDMDDFIQGRDKRGERFDLKSHLQELLKPDNFVGLKSSIALDIEEGLELDVSPFLISVAIEQLIDNAEKQHRHGVYPEGIPITVEAFRAGSQIVIRVADKGDGIESPQAAAEIFDLGFTTRREKGGTGLGTALSEAVVDHYGGTLDAESLRMWGSSEKGATFVIRIPAAGQKNFGDEFKSLMSKWRGDATIRSSGKVCEQGWYRRLSVFGAYDRHTESDAIGRLEWVIHDFHADEPHQGIVGVFYGVNGLSDEIVSEAIKEKYSEACLKLWDKMYGHAKYSFDGDHEIDARGHLVRQEEARRIISTHLALRDKNLALIKDFEEEVRGMLPDNPETEIVYDWIQYFYNRTAEYYYDLHKKAAKIGITSTGDISVEGIDVSPEITPSAEPSVEEPAPVAQKSITETEPSDIIDPDWGDDLSTLRDRDDNHIYIGRAMTGHHKTKTMSNEGIEVINEANRIHAENLKFTPILPQKTILCHIITDSILSSGQINLLKVDLEQRMRGNEYEEKIVALSVDAAASPERFIEELKRVKDRVRKEYSEYNVEFIVACPDKEGLMKQVQKKGIRALAFKREGDGEIVQAEGILLALRTLYTNDISKLLHAYTFLTGRDLTDIPRDINELARILVFVMPARKVGVDEARDINDLIRDNILTAA